MKWLCSVGVAVSLALQPAIKDGAYLPVFDHLADGLFRVIRADADQTQLADFLIDRHFLEQFRDKRVPCFRRKRVIAKQILCQRRTSRAIRAGAAARKALVKIRI